MHHKIELPYNLSFEISCYKDGVENNRWLGIYGNVAKTPVKYKKQYFYGKCVYLELDFLCYRMTLSLEQLANIPWSKDETKF